MASDGGSIRGLGEGDNLRDEVPGLRCVVEGVGIDKISQGEGKADDEDTAIDAPEEGSGSFKIVVEEDVGQSIMSKIEDVVRVGKHDVEIRQDGELINFHTRLNNGFLRHQQCLENSSMSL